MGRRGAADQPSPPSLPVSLKPELFEGMRFDFNKGINNKFSLTHSVFMGSVEARRRPRAARAAGRSLAAHPPGAFPGRSDD